MSRVDTIEVQPREMAGNGALVDLPFTDVMRSGDVISTVNTPIQERIVSGRKEPTTDLDIATPTHDGQTVQFRVKQAAGVTLKAGDLFLITIVVNTTGQDTREAEGFLRVVDIPSL